MKKRSNFEKKYPLFVPYFHDIDVQKNMLENDDLLEKYTTYNESISIFIFELAKRFDEETIKKIIIETIIKYPGELMVSIITAYLNSEESSKSNADFVAFYNKTSNFGISSIKYVEEKGIITTRDYKNIPMLALDDKYKSLKTGEESFKEEKLDDVYNILSFKEKEYIISLLENRSFYRLDSIFNSLNNLNIKTLIDVLLGLGIDTTILNEETFENINDKYLLIMICLLLDIDCSRTSVDNLKTLFNRKRYLLIVKLIEGNLITSLGKINVEEEDMTDDEILEKCKTKELTLNINED